MGILNDLFGGGSERANRGVNDAIKTVRRGNKASDKIYSGAQKSALGALSWGADQGRSALAGGFGEANAYLGKGRLSQLGALNSAYQGARSDLGQGFDQAIGTQNQFMDRARGIFEPGMRQGQSAFTRMGDLQGLNGAGAQAAARSTFQADPGYQFRRDEGIRGLEGSAAANGRLQSGATLKALSDFNSNLASQEYGNFFNRLGQTAEMGMGQGSQLAAAYGQGANAISGLQQGRGQSLAALGSDYGNNIANVEGQFAGQMADNANAYGLNTANLYGQQGQQAANIRTQIGGMRGDQRFKTGLALAPFQMQKGENNAAGASGLAGGLAGLAFGG